jgi:transposase-like protein
LGGIEMSEASFCPRCRSNHISKTGYRFSNEGKVARQRYKCLDCEKWFLAEYIENPGVPKRKIDIRDFEYQNQPIPSQNWTAYTQAQNNEKRVLQNVLKELLDRC